MENNEIMQRLLQDDKQQNSNTKNEIPVVRSNGDKEIPMSRIRVVTAKYKVYIILLVIFICLLLLIYIPNAKDSLNSIRSSYQQANSQLDLLKNDIRIAEEDMVFLCDETNGVIKNEVALGKCLNEKSNCSSLPESWKTWTWETLKYDLSIPLSYLQLHSLYNKKMPVDEKRVLKNLNEYLVKQDISWGDRRKVWDILRIEIGDPEEVKAWDNHFFKVTVDVQIEFENIDDLIGFLYNVEKKLIDKGEDRILYKIQTVSYDIVTNDEPQVTDISMMAYYYHDDKFDDKVECDQAWNSESNNELDEDIDDSADSDSMFSKIFNKIKM